MAEAIHEAWGEDDVGGIKPGLLTTRESDGAKIPQIVADHQYRDSQYANHATPSVVKDALARDDLMELRKGAEPHRDCRDNSAEFAPLTDPVTGLPKLKANGKHL